VVYVAAASFDPAASVTAADGRRWTMTDDAQALSGAPLVSSGHGNSGAPKLPLEYKLLPLTSAGPWALWARVIFPNVGRDSFFYQVSNDGGKTWLPNVPRDDSAVGWEQPQQYAWVKARVALGSPTGQQVDRFLSPAAGMFAGLLHAGLPVKEMHPNHLNRQSLAGFRVLVLANEVCLSDEQCEVIRDFVRNGGGLVATHETSLYDLQGKRRDDFGLADAFGVSWHGSIPGQDGQTVVPAGGEKPSFAPPTDGLPNREEHLSVEARPDSVAAWLSGPGVPGGRAPAVVRSEFGKGRVVYLPGRLDSSYSLWADKGFVALARAAVEWVARGSLPAEVTCPNGSVGATCFDQPSRNRRLVHLVAYNADWVEGFDELPPLTAVRARLGLPAGKQLASVRAVLTSRPLDAVQTGDGVEVVLPRLEEYEVLELKWE
jgi:type 1 glutamine amidotransferase